MTKDTLEQSVIEYPRPPKRVMPPTSEAQLNSIIDKLVKDVELAVHAMYRGDVRQNTAKVRTDSHRRAAYDALRPLVSSETAQPAGGADARGSLASDEATSIIGQFLVAREII